MNIFDRIKQDHDEAREVIEKLKATTPRAEKARRQLFDWLKLEMWLQHKVEEAVFYSFLRETIHIHARPWRPITSTTWPMVASKRSTPSPLIRKSVA